MRSNIGYALDQQKQQERHKAFVENAKKHNIPIPKKKKEPWEDWPTIKQQSSAAQTRVAGLFLCGIRSESELKKPRLISDSRYPGGFSIWLWVSSKLWGNSFIRPLLVKRYWFYRTWRTAHFWAYPLVVTDNMFEHRLHLSKIGHTFLNGVSLSDLIWTYVVTGAYCLVQGRVWRFYQRNKA